MYIIFYLIIYFFSFHFSETPKPKFEAQTIDNNVSIGYGLALGDVDGDGKTDILLADKKQIVWYRNGDWKKFIIAEDLTEHDNVCIAARDITGDGKVEVAVGAQWNPGETSDVEKSGAVFYLSRPQDPTRKWQPVQLHHEPTTHRMRWVQSPEGEFFLVVLPLHGRGNKAGEGDGVKVMAYRFPSNPEQKWETFTVDENMHLTHNFEFLESEDKTELYIAGKQGVRSVLYSGNKKPDGKARRIEGLDQPAGEVRLGELSSGQKIITTIEPMHGNQVVVYIMEDQVRRKVLDDQFKDGHGLAAADFLNLGRDQIVAGWRLPNDNDQFGIKLFVPTDASGSQWESHIIDENEMACEDLQVADLDGDGKPDIIAAGRATNNLKIYWNRNN
ncbi:VCBS repeat-containing protein [soil metagenome]